MFSNIVRRCSTFDGHLNLTNTSECVRLTLSTRILQHKDPNPCQEHLELPSGLPSKYHPGPMFLNLIVQMGTGVSKAAHLLVYYCKTCFVKSASWSDHFLRHRLQATIVKRPSSDRTNGRTRKKMISATEIDSFRNTLGSVILSFIIRIRIRTRFRPIWRICWLNIGTRWMDFSAIRRRMQHRIFFEWRHFLW